MLRSVVSGFVGASVLLLSFACSAPADRVPSVEAESAAGAPRAALDAVLEDHFRAIRDRDLDLLTGTLTGREELPLIFPNGSLLETRQQYLDFHVEWFADPSWTMDIEPVRTLVRGDTAMVLVRTTLEDAGPASRRQAYLTLVFAREAGAWRLIFDQNTRIAADG